MTTPNSQYFKPGVATAPNYTKEKKVTPVSSGTLKPSGPKAKPNMMGAFGFNDDISKIAHIDSVSLPSRLGKEMAKAAGIGDILWEGSKFIPIAGAAPSLWDAGKAALRGDWGTAGMEAGMGALAFIPGVGTAGRAGAMGAKAGLNAARAGQLAKGVSAAGAPGRAITGATSRLGRGMYGKGMQMATRPGASGAASALGRGMAKTSPLVVRHPRGVAQTAISLTKPTPAQTPTQQAMPWRQPNFYSQPYPNYNNFFGQSQQQSQPGFGMGSMGYSPQGGNQLSRYMGMMNPAMGFGARSMGM